MYKWRWFDFFNRGDDAVQAVRGMQRPLTAELTIVQPREAVLDDCAIPQWLASLVLMVRAYVVGVHMYCSLQIYSNFKYEFMT